MKMKKKRRKKKRRRRRKRAAKRRKLQRVLVGGGPLPQGLEPARARAPSGEPLQRACAEEEGQLLQARAGPLEASRALASGVEEKAPPSPWSAAGAWMLPEACSRAP